MFIRIILFCVYWELVFSEPQVGGRNAPPGVFIYEVSIRCLADIHFCGGCIINKNYVLTAAHCYANKHINRTPDQMVIVAGALKIDDEGEKYPCVGAIPHPEYKKIYKLNDICLLIPNRSIRYNENVGPIMLASFIPPPDTPVVISGWGFIDNHRTFPTTLQYRITNIMDLEDCRNHMGDISPDPEDQDLLTSNNICTLNEIGKGDCRGDSGSPLIYDHRLIGLVSFGSRICGSGAPDVYTNIKPFKPWISEVTGLRIHNYYANPYGTYN